MVSEGNELLQQAERVEWDAIFHLKVCPGWSKWIGIVSGGYTGRRDLIHKDVREYEAHMKGYASTAGGVFRLKLGEKVE